MSAERDDMLNAIATVLVDQPRLPMEKLAQALGISRATLHRMFPTREAIVAAILALALETSQRTLDEVAPEEGPADQALQRLVASFMPNAALWLFLRSAHLEGGGRGDFWVEQFELQRQRVLAVFRRGQEEGVLRVDLTAQWMHDATSALLFESVQAVREGRLAPADAVESVVAMLLDGARRHPLPAARAPAGRTGGSVGSGLAGSLVGALMLALVLWSAAPALAAAAEIEGVAFEPRVALAGTQLSVNGTGLRELYVVKTWVAALYTPAPVHSAQALIADRGPRRLAITLLADIPIDRVARDILDALRRGHDPLLLSSLDDQIQEFVAALRAIGPTQKGDTLTLDFAEDSSRIAFNGLAVGEPIPGLLFRDALLRAFVGERPIDDGLRRGLLGLPAPADGSGARPG